MAFPRAAAPDHLWDARDHLPEILEYVTQFSAERSLHFFDFFSGVAEATRAFRSKGYQTENFDLEDGDDINRRAGFFKALGIILMLVQSGLILLGPPCSLWVFFSSSYHKRTANNAAGDESKGLVREANNLVRNVALLLGIAHCRGIYFILEQPSSSQMKNYSWIQRLARALRLKKVSTWMRCFGHVIPKPTYLLANLATAAELRRIWSKQRELQRKAQGTTNENLPILYSSRKDSRHSKVCSSTCLGSYITRIVDPKRYLSHSC